MVTVLLFFELTFLTIKQYRLDPYDYFYDRDLIVLMIQNIFENDDISHSLNEPRIVDRMFYDKGIIIELDGMRSIFDDLLILN